LTSHATGVHPSDRVEGELAGLLFERIRKAHFSVNTNLEERAKQKKLLMEKKKAQSNAAKPLKPDEQDVREQLHSVGSG
jgi:hypothetical protein